VVEVERGAREIKRVVEIYKHFASTFRSPKRGFPFSSPIYSSYSSHKSSPISKFKKAFEAIRKKLKEIVRKH
jgi:hypothetical protein